MQEFFIPTRFPGLNEYTGALAHNRYLGGAMKKEWTELAAQSAQSAQLGHFTEPVFVEFHWNEPNTRRDQDNVAFAKKFILDGLQIAGVITNDNYKCVKGFSDSFYYDGSSGVTVIMREVVDGKRNTELASII